MVRGVYLRMEDRDPTQRFKNGMRLQVLGDAACLEYPKRKRSEARHFVLSLRPEGADAYRIDWTPACPAWGTARLQYVEERGVRGLRENATVFWRLEREYSPTDAERLLLAIQSPDVSEIPVPMLQDGGLRQADDAPVPGAEEVVFAGNQLAAGPSTARQWLDGGSAGLGP